MKKYQSFKQIEEDLRRLSLQRQITIEELKYDKHLFEESLKPLSLLTGVLKFVGKYGVMVLIRRMFR